MKVLRGLLDLTFSLCLGEEASEHYLRVAKKFNKKEDAKKEKEATKPKRGRGSGYHGGYNAFPHFQSQALLQNMAAMAAMQPMFSQQNSGVGNSPMTPRLPKALLRCLNCGELGHFAKKCPKSPSGPK